MKAFALAVSALAMLASGPAFAANTCQAGKLSCPTKMPAGGYCECTANGQTQSGTAVASTGGQKSNANSGGCGTTPNAPGCK